MLAAISALKKSVTKYHQLSAPLMYIADVGGCFTLQRVWWDVGRESGNLIDLTEFLDCESTHLTKTRLKEQVHYTSHHQKRSTHHPVEIPRKGSARANKYQINQRTTAIAAAKYQAHKELSLGYEVLAVQFKTVGILPPSAA